MPRESIGDEPDINGAAARQGVAGDARSHSVDGSPDPAPPQQGAHDANAGETPDADSATPSNRPAGNIFAARVVLEPVITLDEPIDMATAPGDRLMWVAERAGRVLRVDLQAGAVVEEILDISSETVADGERGLLGIAVSEDWMYANFTDLNGDTRLDAFQREGTGLGAVRRTILTQAQPFRNHNGGGLAFGPEGYLYVGFGDGGSAGDPLDHGQNPSTWLGSILRIEPTPSASDAYSTPSGNPFAALPSQGETARPETFLFGVRNPWRFSFDRVTGDLWIADVGQDDYEEVTVLLSANGGGAGANLGWRLREGLHAYAGAEPAAHADPVWEYGHTDGCSVTGGFVYRGSAIAELYGAYVFGDYCTSRLWAIQISTGEVEFADLGAPVPGGALASFAEDQAGELYAMSLEGTVSRLLMK